MGCEAKSSASSLFGINADVLFEITVTGEVSLIPTLCQLNRATYETLKLYESKICARFLQVQGIDSIESLDPILTLDFDPTEDDLEPETAAAATAGPARQCTTTTRPNQLTFKSVQKYLTRRHYARKLAGHLVRTTWAPHTRLIRDENNARVAEKLFTETIERGLYAHAHMADIARTIEREASQGRSVRERPFASWLGAFFIVLRQCIRPVSEWNLSEPPIGLGHQKWSFWKRVRHVREVMLRVCLVEGPTGRRRYLFRKKYLDAEREIDLHVTKVVMCNLLRYIRRGRRERNVPGFPNLPWGVLWQIEEWFFLRQSLRSLAEIFMHRHVTEECECGLGHLAGLYPGLDDNSIGSEAECSHVADILKELHAGYAWNLENQDCACWAWSRVWNMQPTMCMNDGDRYANIADRRRGDRFRLWASNDPDAAQKFELFTGDQEAEEASTGGEGESEPHSLSLYRAIFTRSA